MHSLMQPLMLLFTIFCLQITPATSAQPSLCKTRFDSVMRIDYDVYYFRKMKLRSFVIELKVEDRKRGGPRHLVSRIRDIFPLAPHRVDATIYSPHTLRVYLFRKHKIYRYLYHPKNKTFTFNKYITKFRRNDFYPKKIDYAYMGNKKEIYLVNHMRTPSQTIMARYWKLNERKLKLSSNNVFRMENIYPYIKGVVASAAYRSDFRNIVLFEKNTHRYIRYNGITRKELIFPKELYPDIC